MTLTRTFGEFLLNEAGPDIKWGYMGPIEPILGGDQAERLNYGTAAAFGNRPFLYVKIDPRKGQFAQLAKHARSKLSSSGVECIKGEREVPATDLSTDWGEDMIPDGGMRYGLLGNEIWQCKRSSPSRRHSSAWHDTGEFHVTVAQNFELQPIFKSILGDTWTRQDEISLLTEIASRDGTRLFNRSGIGMMVPVTIPSPAKVVYGLSPAFRGEPIVAIAFVECGRAALVRKIIAEYLMSHHADKPGIEAQAARIAAVRPAYNWHITIATAAKKERELPDGRLVWTTNLGRLSRTSRGGEALAEPKRYASNARKWHNDSYLGIDDDNPRQE